MLSFPASLKVMVIFPNTIQKNKLDEAGNKSNILSVKLLKTVNA